MRLPLWIFLGLVVHTFGNDSLDTALNVVTNRQGHYQDEYTDDPYDSGLYYRPRNNDYEPEAQDSNRNVNLESSLMDYLREADKDDRYEGYQQKSSPFRERLKQDTARPYNKQSKLDEDNTNEPYQNSYYPNEYSKEPQNLYNMKKRSYYPSMRWESVGMKKRSRAFQPDGPRESLYLLNYAPRDEIFNRLQEDENSSDDLDYQWPAYNQKKWGASHMRKRFPVSKRSGSGTSPKSASQMRMRNTRQYKRSSSVETEKKTDPTVAKDLAEIFDAKPSSSKQKSATDKPKLTKLTDLKLKSTKVVQVKKDTNREMAQNKSSQINNNKKSINWSDYFGLDRRKKSEESLDSDWLMSRYNNAIRKQTDNVNVAEDTSRFDNDKDLKEMDNKLRNIEESLIDETLKFIGAHEGASYSKETRYVKDRIISRLAAAYNLEKMRRALSEYRRSFEVDKALLNFDRNQSPHENVKRMSIGRKAAIDPNNEHRDKDDLEDNKIKCHQSNCADSAVYSHALDTCPQVVAICDEISNAFGQHRKSVQAVCEMHQMCVMCSDNNWFGPLRRCDVLYLSKINEICGEEDSNCREHIGNVLNRKLNVDDTADCALVCPENK